MSSNIQILIRVFHTTVYKHPVLVVVASCVLILVFTRLRSGTEKAQLQNEHCLPQKNLPILAYWLPYIGMDLSLLGLLIIFYHMGDGIFSIYLLGTNHYMILMPSLVKQLFEKRPSVISSDDFIHWIYDKYLGDGGISKALAPDDFHTVHRILNSLVKEPFLSTATETTVELVQERVALIITWIPSDQNFWEQHANVTLNENSAEADLFEITTNFVADIAGTAIKGRAFFKNNQGIEQDLWVLDISFGSFMTGVPMPGFSKAKAARSRLNSAMEEWNYAVLDFMDGNNPGPKCNNLSNVSETMELRLKALQN